MSGCDECRWAKHVNEVTAYMTYSTECLLDHSLWAGSNEGCEHFGYDPMEGRTCGGCEFYLGIGDWGLSCKKTYLKLVHAFDDAGDCKDYRKVTSGNGLVGELMLG